MTEKTAGSPGTILSNAVADAVERSAASTVLVNGRKRLPSSGIAYASDLVLTADHTVEREEDLRVVLPDGSEVAATLAGRDRGADLALLRVQGASLTVFTPAQQAARVGHLVVAIGRPSTEGVQASLGMITALGSGLRTGRGAVLDQYLLTDAVPYPGFSGGPLVDFGGELLGINTSGLVRGTSLAIPARLAWDVARSLAEYGRVKRGYLGIRSQQVELPEKVSLGREQATGLLVVGVEQDGPAAAAGWMVGDILVGLGGEPVADHDDLMLRLSGSAAGKQTDAQLMRGGQLINVTVTIGEKS